MKKIAILFILIANFTFAQTLTRPEIVATIDSNITTNGERRITGAVLNTVLKKFANSYLNLLSDPASGGGVGIPFKDTIYDSDDDVWTGYLKYLHTVISSLDSVSQLIYYNGGVQLVSSKLITVVGSKGVNINSDSIINLASPYPIFSSIQTSPLPIIPVKHIIDSVYTIIASDAGKLLIQDTVSVIGTTNYWKLPYYSDVAIVAGSQFKIFNSTNSNNFVLIFQEGQTFYHVGCLNDYMDLNYLSTGTLTNIGADKWIFENWSCD